MFPCRPRCPRWIAAGLLVLVLAGCGGGDPGTEPEPEPKPVLVIGLIPEQDVFRQLDRYTPLAGYLGDRSGAEIRLKVLPRYGNIIDNFRSAEMDGAFFGSFTYALAHERLGISVLARPLAPDGTSTYHGLIFIRGDSGIGSVEAMRGKRFVFVDKATTAGYLLPLDFFYRSGIGDYREFFGETYFAGTHENAILDVLEGRADVGAAKNTVFQRLAQRDPRVARDLLILKRSPDVPENALALRSDLDEGLRGRLGDILLAMHQDPDGAAILRGFGAIRFIPTRDEDYATVFEYAKEVGLDLATYDYRND